MSTEEAAGNEIASRLSEQLLGVFDGAAESQRAHFAAHPEKRPRPTEVDGIISYYANLNAGISGAVSLVPGPWGMAAAVPEILLVIRNQVKMVYEIGVAYGKDDVLTRELLLGITMSAAGVGVGGLMVMHGSKVAVKRATLRVLQKMVALLAGKVTQQVLKSMVAKWLPFVGAAAIAAWTRYSTASIGRVAKQVLQLDVVVDSDAIPEDEQKQLPGPDAREHATTQKILALSNLAKADGRVGDVEQTYIDTLVANAALPENARAALRARTATPDQQPVDLAALDEDDALGLLMDLVALASRDGVVHPAEKLYIRRVAKQLPLAEADVASLLDFDAAA